jgi:hypothetical protein
MLWRTNKITEHNNKNVEDDNNRDDKPTHAKCHSLSTQDTNKNNLKVKYG